MKICDEIMLVGIGGATASVLLTFIFLFIKTGSEITEITLWITTVIALLSLLVTLILIFVKYSAERLELTIEKMNLMSKIEKLQTENKNLRKQIESEYSESETEY